MTLKYSRQRQAICDFLETRTDHPTAESVYVNVRNSFPNISLGTVYRNLALLTNMGEIRRLAVEGGADHYDGNLTPHSHFFCRSCGAILDLAPVDSRKLEQAAGAESGGVVEETTVWFSGLCSRCAGTAEEQTAGKQKTSNRA